MKIKLLAAAIAVAAIPTVAISSAQAQRAPAANVIVVDVQRVVNECAACQSAAAALRGQEATFQTRRQQLGLVAAAPNTPSPIEAEQADIQRAVNALQGRQPDAALQGRIQAFQQRVQAAERELAQLQYNFESTRAHVSQQIQRALDPIYNEVMTGRGANLVVPTSNLLANAPALDVTGQVLALLNQRLPATSLSITPMPQQPGPAQPAQPQPQQPRPTGR